MKTLKHWTGYCQLFGAKMKAVPIFLAMIFFTSTGLISQYIDYGPPVDPINYCGKPVEGNAPRTADIKQRTIDRRVFVENGGVVNETQITIPTVFHIIHATADNVPGQGSNLSDAQIYSALAHLNNAFDNNLFSGQSTASNISFCLASQNSNGVASPGITRFPSDNFTNFNDLVHDVNGPIGPNSVKAITADPTVWNRRDYLNIWIVESIIKDGEPNVAGYATLPGNHGEWWDGIILESAFLGSSVENDRVLIHETGHYLNLLHTFGNGDANSLDCSNNDCLLENDHVCDTAPDRQGFTCMPGINSCTTDGDDMSANNPFAGTDVDDPILNYMDYGNLACEEVFTAGQSVRMRLTIIDDLTGEELMRGSLLHSMGCCTPSLAANFTTTNTGLQVTFDASTSTGPIADYVWDFGDGAIVTTTTAVTNHTFVGPGLQQVTLTVTPQDGSGCISAFTLNLDLCAGSLAEDFTVNVVDNTADFTALANPDGYFWDFGDGNTSALQNPTHTYAGPGLYMVCLSTGLVNDPCNIPTCQGVNISTCDPAPNCDEHICNGDFQNIFPIHSSFYPQVGLPFWNGQNDIGTGTVDNLIDISNGNVIIGWGNFFWGVSEAFYYPIDPPLGDGCSATISFDAGVRDLGQIMNVYLASGAPCNEITFDGSCTMGNMVPDPLCNGFSLTCIDEIMGSDITSGVLYNGSLQFGDAGYPYPQDLGTVSTVTTPAPLTNVTIPWVNNTGAPVDFIIVHTLRDPAVGPTQFGFIDNLSVTSACPGAEFTFSIDCSTVTFTSGNNSPGSSHLWNFGDGNTSTNPNPVHTYAANGTYIVSHTLFTPCGPEVETAVVVINDISPDPLFTNTAPDCGTVVFNSDDQDPLTTHFWDFGDGNISTDPNPTHTYATEGNFPVVHTVLNNCGSEFFSVIITIDFDLPDPRFDFVIDCADVTFGAVEMDPAVVHSWDFGDGTTAGNDPNPVHTYASAGTYIVTHTVSNNCGSQISDPETVGIDLAGCQNLCACPNGGIAVGNGGSIDLDQTALPANQMIGGCVSIDGHLNIEEDYTFDGVEFVMSPSSTINIIGQGNTLTIINSELHGCTEMWEGIWLREFGELDFRDNIIRNAFRTIVPSDHSRLRVQDNDFIENRIGIFTPTSSTGQTIFVKRFNGDRVTGNNFSCPNTLLPPFAGSFGFAGVYIGNTRQFYIGKEGENANTFADMNYGVYARNCSDLKIYDSEFFDLIINNTGIRLDNCSVANQIKRNTMSDVTYGVHSQRSTFWADENNIQGRGGIFAEESYDVNIIDNIFDINELGHGINVRAQQQVPGLENDLFILDNEIMVHESGFGIYYWNSNAFTRIEGNSILALDEEHPGTPYESVVGGIAIFSCEGQTIVQDNTVDEVDIVTSSWGSNGILSHSSSGIHIVDNAINTLVYPQGPKARMGSGIVILQSPNNNICCNTVAESQAGVQFQGMANNSNFRNTTFGEHTWGLTVSEAVIGKQINHGNQWQVQGGNIGLVYDAFHWGPEALLELNRFEMAAGFLPNGTQYVDVQNGTVSQWFGLGGSVNPDCDITDDSYCNIQTLINNGPGETARDLNAIDVEATKIIGNSAIEKEGTYFEAQRYLYAKLKIDPALLSKADPAIENFDRNNAGGNLSYFYDANELLKSNFRFENDFYQMHKMTNNKLASIENMEKAWGDASPGLQPAIAAQIEGLQQELAVLVDNYSWYLENRTQKAQDLFAEINYNLSQINATTIPEINRKRTMEILVNAQSRGSLTFTVNETADIRSIAAQCPLEGGSGVFLARTMQHTFEWVDYPLDQDCSESKKREDRPEEVLDEDGSYSVRPNPTNGQVQLSNLKENAQNTKVEIYSLQGVLIKSLYLKGGTTESINLNEYPGGIYYCKFFETEHLITTRKLVLIK